MLLYMVNHPRLLSLACLVGMGLMARFGSWASIRLHVSHKSEQNNLGLVVGATLTLLGLIIGFTFSMATTRYDQRRLYEEGEANAIGTEYVRADLLPPDQAAAVKAMLAQYLHHRIDFYQADYGTGLDAVDRNTSLDQMKLWKLILAQSQASPTPVQALVVSGMNDVLNSQGYTQFAWWNRIPTAAWALMIGIAFFSNLLVGYATERTRNGHLLMLVLPIIAAVSFFLVSDIDSPRGGIIRIPPRDLIALSQGLPATP